MRWVLAMSVVLASRFLHPVLAQDTIENSGRGTRTDTLAASRAGTSGAAIGGAVSGALAAPMPPPAPPPQRYEEVRPKAEASLGYWYIRANLGSPIEGTNLHGRSGSIAFNANDWFGIVADFGGYKLPNLTVAGFPSFSANSTLFSYLFGPRFSYRRHERITPSVQAEKQVQGKRRRPRRTPRSSRRRLARAA